MLSFNEYSNRALNEAAVKWNKSEYLYNYKSPRGKSYSTEDDGMEGYYNPRFDKGRRVIKAPKLTSSVVAELEITHSGRVKNGFKSSFYDPWYEYVKTDYSNVYDCVVVVIRDKTTNQKYTFYNIGDYNKPNYVLDPIEAKKKKR